MTETQIREFVRRVVQATQSVAELTPTEFDDKACEMVLKVVNNDTLWGWIWSLVDQWIVDENAPILVSAPPAGMEAEAINPLLVIAIIKAAIALWKAFHGE